MNDFPFKMRAIGIGIGVEMDMDSIVATTLKNRVQRVDLTRDLNFNLYGDTGEPEKLSLYQRLTRRVQTYRSRIQDAWLVLTGRAEIGGDW